jgi:hypothetical protein
LFRYKLRRSPPPQVSLEFPVHGKLQSDL